MKTLYYGIAFFLSAIASPLFSQSHIDTYVRYGLENNRTLHQHHADIEKATEALKVARSYFLPSISFLADYTSGRGGRNISIPMGDLLNPVYASLNGLTQSDAFPQINNVSQDFFPYNFHDARVRTSVPLVNTDLLVSREIEGKKVIARKYETETFKRQLVLDIKTAYYHHLAALEAVKIFKSALNLVIENVRVNESLLRNNKVLPANVLRARSEAESIMAELTDAEARVSNSRKYFNFLLNRPLDEDILVDSDFSLNEEADLFKSENQREEIIMLQTARDIAESAVKMHQLSRLPRVNAFFDLGTQSEGWRFNDQSRYFLVGVQLSMPIFQGFRTNMFLRQSRQDINKIDLQLNEVAGKIQVATDVAENNLVTAKKNFLAARQQLEAARSYFKLIDKGFLQGVNSQIEFIDARNQYTQAELKVNLKQYEMLIAAAQLERETSSFNLSK